MTQGGSGPKMLRYGISYVVHKFSFSLSSILT